MTRDDRRPGAATGDTDPDPKAARASSPPSGGPVRRLEVQVRFGDTDALGHVNNAAYASYAELGRIDLLRGLRWDDAGPILARLAIDFHAQVKLGSRVEITTRAARVGRSSIELYQEVLADGVRAAAISSVVVWFDYRAQRPVRVPARLREDLLGPAGAEEASAGT